VGTALFIAWWYWSISKQSANLNDQVRAAEAEAARLRQLIQQVQQFEQRKSQLQQRVVLIEQLRRGQSGPVHLLDQISRSLPEGLWLTEIKQQGDMLLITGRCTGLGAPSDFAQNLEASGYFRRPVEIQETQSERAEGNQPELIRFSIRAQYAPPAG
jgi:type IV pilus assembly protein PilN